MGDYSRMCPERSLFMGMLRSLEVLGAGSKDGEGGLVACWDSLLLDGLGPVVRWYRAVGHEFSLDPLARAYVHRCMGHRLDRGVVFRHPCVAALCAVMFHGGRWRDCEGVVSGDHAACYLYARGLGGRLPMAMHNRLVLEGGSCFARRYLSEFGGVW